MSSILVTGAEGQLGQCFQELAKEYPIHNLFFLSKKLWILQTQKV